jgi:predicted glycoside hydrolase/deacetylase ChbG (UPF0249 family)
LGIIQPEDIKREISAQIKQLKEWDITITHIDSHQHIHVLPPIFKILLECAKENNIQKIRYPYQCTSANPFSLKPQNIKRILIKYFLKISEKENSKDVFVTDYFFGISEMGITNNVEVLKKFLLSLKNGVTEMMCHPGYYDNKHPKFDGYTFHRENELKALLNPELKRIIQHQKIHLLSYRDLE